MTEEPVNAIRTSYAELIRNARAMADVSAWYTAHPEVLGALGAIPNSQVSVEANLSIGAISMLLTGKTSGEGFKAKLKVTIGFSGVAEPPYADITGLGPITSSMESSYTTSMYMPFAVWPLAIAELAFDYIACEGYLEGYKETCREISRKVLDQYLPVHFPGIDVNWLDSMQSMGFFPVDSEKETTIDTNGCNRDAFFAALFNSRQSQNEHNIPTELHF